MGFNFSMRFANFRTRNPERNFGTDMDRLMTVKRSVEASIASVVLERDGLQRRIDLYYAQASNLIEQTAEFGARSQSDEASITLAEKNAVMAAARIAQVSEQIVGLHRVLDEVETMLATLHAGHQASDAASAA